MNEVALLLKSFGVAYQGYMAWKFERLIQKAEAHGMTEEELCNSDQRFALFMRVGRAFEICSEREVVDYIADAMIGGIKSGDVENKPDFVHMAISALSGITKTELDILLMMHRHQIYVDADFRRDHDSHREAFIKECEDTLGIKSTMLSPITTGLMRTGLVTSDTTGLSGTIQNPYSLSLLARELFSYINLARRLTE
ncbi:hypothetical protein LPL18_011460 [Halomonas sp. CUBES01]|uniref:hypothetical protein n=1 Tax=Halomonas sp. CUBES01 TaxID=2897340 RepID=UPI001E3CC171|nr:hypothetical protein [Halomonas sp. CUBES01]MEC4767942.1 hypothetical protein [Halomonas sp. CUBES01]